MSPEAKLLGDKPARPVETNTTIYTGMTVRQAFAMAAMEGCIAAGPDGIMVINLEQSSIDAWAKFAVRQADALLEALAKEGK